MLKICVVLIWIVSLVACGPTNTQPTLSSVRQQIDHGVEAGSSLTPAHISAQPSTFSSQAIQAYYAGDIEDAKFIYSVLESPELEDNNARLNLDILALHWQMDRGVRLDSDAFLNHNPSSVTQRFDLMFAWAKSLKQTDNTMSTMVALDRARQLRHSVSSKRQSSLNLLTWQTVIELKANEIDQLINDSEDGSLQVWLQLARSYRNSTSEPEWHRAVTEISEKQPQSEAVMWFKESHSSQVTQTIRLAFLLPQSGSDSIAVAAKAIRDGWLRAHFENSQKSESSAQPVIHFYDTAISSAADLVVEALDQGATHVVGPLAKEQVDSINESEMSAGRILLLNRPNQDTANSHLRHVAWTIEDEAEVLAEHVSLQSNRRCVVFLGNESWMLRALAHFQNHLVDPTQVVGIEQIADYESITDTVGTGLGADESRERHESLQNVIRYDVEFQPRLNQEINCVTAFLDEVQLQAILESLRYYSDRNLDIFVTESALRTGIPIQASGVVFPASPWMLSNAASERDGKLSPAMQSFEALGYDAYRLVLRWDSLTRFKSLNGLGGQYRLKPGGAIHRGPILAIIDGSSIRPLSSLIDTENTLPFL